jgi:ferredoxin-NADP reductase
MSTNLMEAEQTRQQEQTLQLEVAEKRVEAEGVVSLTLRSADGEPLPPWTPGAHVDVVLDDDLVRQYSLCGEPSEADTWRLGVLREPNSRGGSRRVHDEVERGQHLTVRGPRNNFSLQPAEQYLFVAGGIGITPILPMVRQAAALGTPWTLLYGGRSRASMAFVEELIAIGGGELMIRPQDEFGLLDLEAYLGTPIQGAQVYSCGPGPLLDAVTEHCASWPSGSLHLERFVASTRTSSEDPFVVELARSGRRITVPQYESMLDVLEQEGYEVTNSCRAGICGTCLTDVVAGIPEHNDDVLSDEDRASNKVMLPCVSRSRTDVLVIDL